MNIRAGIVGLKIDGNIYDVKGNIDYSLGKPARTPLVGDAVFGYTETPTVPSCECVFVDSGDLSLDTLSNITDSTITINLANGKIIAFRNAWCANPDGLMVSTDEGSIKVKFNAKHAEEIK